MTYIRNWDKVKFLADAGLLAIVRLILTGSDLCSFKRLARVFRDGAAWPTRSIFMCIHCHSANSSRSGGNLPPELLDQYLMHGGFLTAINDYKEVVRSRPPPSEPIRTGFAATF